jgi:hypothetical protein
MASSVRGSFCEQIWGTASVIKENCEEIQNNNLDKENGWSASVEDRISTIYVKSNSLRLLRT